jgi:hypothetical protein
LSFDILWCFHLTPSGNPFCCQPFYETCRAIYTCYMVWGSSLLWRP